MRWRARALPAWRAGCDALASVAGLHACTCVSAVERRGGVVFVWLRCRLWRGSARQRRGWGRGAANDVFVPCAQES